MSEEKKTVELNEEVLDDITGGMISFEPVYELLRHNDRIKQELLNNGILISEHEQTLCLSKNTIKKMIDSLCKTLDMDPSELLEYLLNNQEKQQ